MILHDPIVKLQASEIGASWPWLRFSFMSWEYLTIKFEYVYFRAILFPQLNFANIFNTNKLNAPEVRAR